MFSVILATAIFLTNCSAKTLSENSIENSTLRVAFQPIVQTDPSFISSDSEIFIGNAVYAYLIDLDAKSNLVARLATDWRVPDNGLTYTLILAEGVKFHDKSPLTAEDVVWTFNRLIDPSLGFATEDLYRNIDTITAPDPQTVIFTLKTPNPFFLYDLNGNHALVIKNGMVDAGDFNGTGPFMVVEYNPEDRIILTANPDYFIPGQPKLAEVDVVFFPDEIAMINALRDSLK